ncbi:MAG: RelA/SpoT family protein [Clostridia bacterium]
MEQHGKSSPEIEENVRRAYDLCKEAHSAQVRLSGEPYYIHPVAVAQILAEMGMDSETVIAGLLHDVIEDTKYGYDEVKAMFGDDVALLVDGVTKLKKIKYVSREDQQVENLRKMFFAMAKDIRVILIKLADRLHNMRTLKYMSPEKQRVIAKETLDVYAPLAHRLGISKIKCELEDLSLRYLDSVAFYEIAQGLDQKKAERDAYVQLIRDTIETKMNAMGIKSQISGRAKHIYSIYRKMYAQGKTLDEIYDLFAVRIIVDDVSECYAALGMVHEQYKPIPGRFKDYIAMPKPNMYQSLHTTVIGPDGRPFEIQIRTWEMHRVAEQGIAAHWKYKEGATAADEKKLAWVDQLLEIQRDADSDEDFMRTLKIDMFADEVFVFTPKGNVISLPMGATPIDFAFYIHTAVGYRMTGAKANTRIVPLDYKLQNGDIVEILTSSAVKGPSRDWLKIVKTSQARNKINAWFKKENREANIEKGREAIDREIKRLNYGNLNLLRNDFLEPMLKRYGFNTVDEMYAAVGYGGITSAKIVTRLKESYNQIVKEEPAEPVPAAQKPKKNGGSGIEVEGIDNCLVRLSKCCNPVAGDDIIGFITRGRGVSVHRRDCINVRPEALTEEMRSRMINCTWAGPSGNYSCELQIEGPNRDGMLGDVTNVIGDTKLPLLAVNARTTKDKMAVINITVEVSDKSQVDALIKKLYRIPGIFEVHRC